MARGAATGGGWINTLPSLPNLVTSGGDTYLFGLPMGLPAPGGARPVYWMSNTTSSTVTVISHARRNGLRRLRHGSLREQHLPLGIGQPQIQTTRPAFPNTGSTEQATALPLPSGASNGSGDYVVATGSDFYIAGDEVDTDELFFEPRSPHSVVLEGWRPGPACPPDGTGTRGLPAWMCRAATRHSNIRTSAGAAGDSTTTC